MGRMLLFVLELLLLGIGVILATFQALGNDDTAIKELMLWVSGPALSCAIILRYFACSWSGPVDVLGSDAFNFTQNLVERNWS